MESKSEFVSTPKTAAVVGRNTRTAAAMLRRHGIRVVNAKPDLVVTVGGDGCILHSERLYPGVPKLCFRQSAVCAQCHDLGGHKKVWHCQECIDAAVAKVALKKRIAVRKERKLEGTAIVTRNGKTKRTTLLALNEVQVHNNSPLHAVRGAVKINGRKASDFIGDGVIAATPYGSTGYYYAACKKTFKKGLGLCFNNPTTKLEPITLKDDDVVEIELTRRHGLFVVDNNPKTTKLDAGDKIRVKYSKNYARFVKL